MSDDRARVCVVGSINMDLIVRTPRLPLPGETLMGGPFASLPGGKGANQAVASARMGAEVSMAGCVGDDAHGTVLLETLRASGIDVSAVRVRAGVPTGVGLITVAQGGENTIVVAPGANGTVSVADVDAARGVIARADVLLMQLEIPFETSCRAAAIARESGVTVILNAAPAAKLPEELLLGVDVLVLNRSEGELLAGLGAEAARGAVMSRLAAMGPGTVVMTLGAEGAVHVQGGSQPRDVEAFCVEPVDTVGAGDAFCGAMAVRWAEHQVGGAAPEGLTLVDTLAWASAAGALATTRAGAIPSLPMRREVAGLLRGQGR